MIASYTTLIVKYDSDIENQHSKITQSETKL